MSKASLNILYAKYKKRAEKAGLEFDLTLNEFKMLTKQNCYLCDVEPSQSFNNSQDRIKPYIHNGIDRVDSSLGYVYDNVKPCCSVCNFMKRSMSLSEFRAHIGRLVMRFLND